MESNKSKYKRSRKQDGIFVSFIVRRIMFDLFVCCDLPASQLVSIHFDEERPRRI